MALVLNYQVVCFNGDFMNILEDMFVDLSNIIDENTGAHVLKSTIDNLEEVISELNKAKHYATKLLDQTKRNTEIDNEVLYQSGGIRYLITVIRIPLPTIEKLNEILKGLSNV